MKPEDIKRLKELVVTAIFSEDTLMERLVFKGGNALDLIYGISERASFDLDFSIPGQFEADEMPVIEARLKHAIETEFRLAGYRIFDFNFKEKPSKISDAVKDFWGGYAVDFKFIGDAGFQQYQHDINALRRHAVSIGKQGSTKVEIDISKYEVCDGKAQRELNDYVIYVYTPEMLVFEKLRAICQQTQSYRQVITTHKPRARARDFYDIHTLMRHCEIDINSDKNKVLLRRIFDAKKAILSRVELEDSKQLHRPDFESLRATLPASAAAALEDFDAYFDFVLDTFGPLESLWHV